MMFYTIHNSLRKVRLQYSCTGVLMIIILTLLECIFRKLISVMTDVSIDAYKMAMHTITTFDQRANLPNISVPNLLISGEVDTNSPAPMMTKMASKIPGSRYVEMAATGHMGPIENTDVFNGHLIEFLNGITNE